MLLSAMAASCRSAKEIQTEIVTEYVHDTTTEYIHDTTIVKETRYDSVDREVERIVYVDSNGVWHEKEKETLHHYIKWQDEKYKAKEAEYKSKISELEKQLAEKTEVVYVEKKLSWIQKTLMYCGVAFFLTIAILCIIKFKKKR